MNILFVTALDLVGEFVEALPEIKMTEIVRKPLSGEQFVSIIKKEVSQSQSLVIDSIGFVNFYCLWD